MRSKIAPENSWWEQAAGNFDEKLARKQLEADIDKQRRAILLAGKILTLRQSPAYGDFVKALQDLREASIRQLTLSDTTNEHMRVIQGQVQAYDNILAVTDRGDVQVKALERALTELQNKKALLDRPQRQEATS